MYTPLNSKERLGYTVFGFLILGIVWVVGYRFGARSRQDLAATAPALKTTKTPTGAQSGSEVVVDVVGAVHRPGVYHLRADARVNDAVKAAGGGTAVSDLDAINLAGRLSDGQQLRIPLKSDGATAGVAPVGEPDRSGARGKIGSASVSLNSAGIEDLEAVPGIGPVTAQKIIDWRTANGGFTSIDQLRQVGGIGEKKLARIAPHVHL